MAGRAPRHEVGPVLAVSLGVGDEPVMIARGLVSMIALMTLVVSPVMFGSVAVAKSSAPAVAAFCRPCRIR